MSTDENKLCPSEADVEKAQAAHRKVYNLTAGGHEVLCRGPKRPEWNRFLDVALNAAKSEGAKGYAASKTLFTQCLIWPTAKEFDSVCDDEPMLESALASAFVSALQEGYAGEAKKLLAASSAPGATSCTRASASLLIGAAKTARKP